MSGNEISVPPASVRPPNAAFSARTIRPTANPLARSSSLESFSVSVLKSGMQTWMRRLGLECRDFGSTAVTPVSSTEILATLGRPHPRPQTCHPEEKQHNEPIDEILLPHYDLRGESTLQLGAPCQLNFELSFNLRGARGPRS